MTVKDWALFDNRFSAILDFQSIPAVTKFSHLKEVMVERVCIAIDGLPFNQEGYEQANKHLLDK